MRDLVSTEFLSSLAGMAAVTSVIVQVLKSNLGIDPRWINLLVSMIVSIIYTVILVGDMSPTAMVLMVINGFVVTGASTGAYENIIKPIVSALK